MKFYFNSKMPLSSTLLLSNYTVKIVSTSFDDIITQHHPKANVNFAITDVDINIDVNFEIDKNINNNISLSIKFYHNDK